MDGRRHPHRCDDVEGKEGEKDVLEMLELTREAWMPTGRSEEVGAAGIWRGRERRMAAAARKGEDDCVGFRPSGFDSLVTEQEEVAAELAVILDLHGAVPDSGDEQKRAAAEGRARGERRGKKGGSWGRVSAGRERR